MAYDRDRAGVLVEEAAGWATSSKEAEGVMDKLEPLAGHFTEISGYVVSEVLIAVAKALQAGYFYGKYGFPEERIPTAFKDAFKEEGGE